jgi:ferredoxin
LPCRLKAGLGQRLANVTREVIDMEKTNIIINAKECTECLACQLVCSLTYTDAFNLEKARIVIETMMQGETSRTIRFTDECVAGCHLCSDYCVYGALVRR